MPIIAMYPVLALMLLQQPALSRASLDYEFFKARIQPILTAKREGHARCVSCHASGTPMRLQPIAPGNATWTEEDARKNFDIIRLRVTPGNPAKEQTPDAPAGRRGRRGSDSRRRKALDVAERPRVADTRRMGQRREYERNRSPIRQGSNYSNELCR